jgi:ADP-ribose pyrophosphatase YjhB (NUDIX family)
MGQQSNRITEAGKVVSVAGVAVIDDAPEAARLPRVRVAAIIVRDDCVLLVRHAKGEHTYWLLPGGGVHYGEPLDEALRRELMEEACVDIEVGELVLAVDSIPPDASRHTLHLYFTATIIAGEPRCGSDERVVEVRFVPVRELSRLPLFPDVRDTLIQAIRDGFPNRATYAGKLWQSL